MEDLPPLPPTQEDDDDKQQGSPQTPALVYAMKAYQDIAHRDAVIEGINSANTHANEVDTAGEETGKTNNYVSRSTSSTKAGELIARKPEN